MKVLVIGSGGREHALVWKISKSPRVEKIFCVPGNAGMAELAACDNISIADFSALVKYVKTNQIDITVVGPEVPLGQGIVNFFESKGLKIFGPNKKAANLECSKVFSKVFMKKHGIPTAEFQVFKNYSAAIKYIDKVNGDLPLKKYSIIKADGLCAGKGVVVAQDLYEVKDTISKMMVDKIYGDAGKQIIIEERIEGEEASIMAFCDGKTVSIMMPSQDHKRIFENDKGPNTGGMGAYAPAPVVTKSVIAKAKTQVFDNFIKGLKKEKIVFKGIIYAGIMIDCSGNIKVLEFNVRFGDPETQCVLPLLETDIMDIIEAVIDGKLSKLKIKWKKDSCICVVLASKGYPGKYETGKRVSGLEYMNAYLSNAVFHAGTTMNESGSVVTSGGRVLGITGWDKTLNTAIKKTYEAMKEITFEGMQYRRDIGVKGLRHLAE
ncbi:MAG: phosphoribosylamine--glycine ligase [Elusimicrobia bacterium RIFOXYA2_FULL_39_19]|nr:MAG: phosphoribosylamine--glycine ligase [Elusimicrobia bacterium RIFOXYA2_FULL_39_19]